MSDSDVQLPSTTGNSGPLIDTIQVVTGVGTVQRQRVDLGSVGGAAPNLGQETGGNLAAVAANTAPLALLKTTNAAPAGPEVGAVVRPIMPPQGFVYVPYSALDSALSSDGALSILGLRETQNQEGGSGAHIVLATSATLAHYAEIGFFFNGSVFGLVCELDTGNQMPGVMIDGVAYDVPTFPPLHPLYGTALNIHPRISGQVLAQDLGPGAHYCQIMFPANVSVQNAWYLYGYLLDAKEGYLPLQNMSSISTVGKAIGNGTYTDLTDDISTSTEGGAGIRQVEFYNSTGSPIIVTLSKTSSSAGAFSALTVPAGLSVVRDFGSNLSNRNYLFASANGPGLVAALVKGF